MGSFLSCLEHKQQLKADPNGLSCCKIHRESDCFGWITFTRLAKDLAGLNLLRTYVHRLPIDTSQSLMFHPDGAAGKFIVHMLVLQFGVRWGGARCTVKS